MDILENIKNEYKIVISNLEELQQRFSEIEKKNIIADTIYGIKIDVILITNNSIIYNTIGYKIYKKCLYRNLHVINRETFYVTNSDIEEFKNKLYKIYSKIHSNFMNELNKGNSKLFNENLLITLKETIKILREKSKSAEDIAEEHLKDIKKKDEEEKAKIIENTDSEYITALQNAEMKQVAADKATTEYNSKKNIVEQLEEQLEEHIANLNDPSVIQVTGSNLGNQSDIVEAGEAEAGESEAGKSEVGNDAKSAIATSSTGTDRAIKTVNDQSVITDATALITTDLPTNTELPVTNFIKYISVNGIDQGNIPDNIWKIIVMNEEVSDEWKDIIKKWVSKSTKDAENKKRWAEGKEKNGGKPISEEVKFDNEESKKRDYWYNILKDPPVSSGDEKYSIKPLAQLQEIKLIGEIPSRRGKLSKKNLKIEREDRYKVFNQYIKNIKFLDTAARKYYKEKFGKEIDINDYYSEFDTIKREFLEMDEYSNNILDKEYIYDKEVSDDEIRNFNIAHRKTIRTRYYLNKKHMDFYKNYIDVFNNFSNINESKIKENVNLFLLPSENDKEIWKFKQLDRFLAKMYDLRNTNMKSSNEKNKERNIIVLPDYDKITYNKYINFFNTHYNDLKEGTNLIFKGKSYKLKTAEELAEIMKGTP
jgi:hypothetical protein